MRYNGTNMLNRIEFDEHIKKMTNRDLLEFIAWQTYDVVILADNNKNRITKMESRNKKFMGFVGAGGSLVGAALVTVIDFFMQRNH